MIEDDEETSYEEWEDFDQIDFLDEEDTEELDFNVDESYKGEPEIQDDDVDATKPITNLKDE
jgi:hypothetical protein